MADVLTVGFGKAGSVLHGPHWLNEGFNIVATDTNPARLETAYLSDTMRVAQEAGRLTTLDSLSELSAPPSIIDITTASGHHEEAVNRTLEALDRHGVRGRDLTWLIEKPIVSSEAEGQRLMSLFEAGDLDLEKVFVNENYVASRGVDQAVKIVEQGSSPVTQVDVVFYKNRLPDEQDEKKPRFVDRGLNAFGIEVSHMLAVGQGLSGMNEHTPTEIIQSDYYHDVHGVDGSEGTYTIVRANDSGVILRMAQGLGPFEMDADGNRTPNAKPGIIRYATAEQADGHQVRVDFDPVPGIPRYHSKITWQGQTGNTHSMVVGDNTLRFVIGGVAEFSRSGQVPPFEKGIRVGVALGFVQAISSYAKQATHHYV